MNTKQLREYTGRAAMARSIAIGGTICARDPALSRARKRQREIDRIEDMLFELTRAATSGHFYACRHERTL